MSQSHLTVTRASPAHPLPPLATPPHPQPSPGLHTPPSSPQLKPSNVLLRSAPHDPRGFTCKLSDFGCVQLLRELPSSPPTADPAPGPLSHPPPATSHPGILRSQPSSTLGTPMPASGLGAAAAAAAAAGAGLQQQQQQQPHRWSNSTGAPPAGGGVGGGGGGAGGVGGGSDGRLGFLSGHVLGTPSHLAPEAFLPGNMLDTSVDIYRLVTAKRQRGISNDPHNGAVATAAVYGGRTMVVQNTQTIWCLRVNAACQRSTASQVCRPLTCLFPIRRRMFET